MLTCVTAISVDHATAHPAVVAASASTRLVANAGFESSASTPTSWTVSGTAVSMVTSPVDSGLLAARIVDSSSTAGVSLRSAPIATMPGEDLTATIWVDRTSGAGGWLYLEFWRADGARSTATSVAVGSSSGWQQVTAEGVAPDDAVTATVLAYSAQTDVGTTVWDDTVVSALPPPLRHIPDMGFEEPRDASSPTEWTVSAPGGSATVVTGTVHSGLTVLKTVDTSSSQEVSVLSRLIPVTVGEVITASVWADQLSGSAGTLYLEFRDASGTRLGTPPTVNVTGSGWHRVSVSGTAPSGTAGLTIRLYSTQAATGTTLWDDVSLRSSADSSYDPALAAGAPVLFVGDQRVESYAGVGRAMQPGTKAGTGGIVLSGTGTWDANPRLSGTVLPGGPGYTMWYSTSTGTGYADSADGINWSREGRTSTVYPLGNGGVVQNPSWISGGGQPKFFMLRSGSTSDPNAHYYYEEQSTDGIAWTAVAGATPIPGWDVPNVTYDPTTGLFVAMTKQYPIVYAPPASPTGPRTVWMSTSSDFKTWTAPQPAFAADFRDDQLIPAGTGKHGATAWSEVYGMPAIRYGDQYLGLPWVFDIAYSPNRDTGDPGPDTGRSHIELAASTDLVNWSRPDRDNLIAPGAAEQWDWGFDLTGTTLQDVLVNGQWQTRLYYSAFAGEHSCDSTAISAGNCTVAQGNSTIGLVTWPTDRFESFHAATGGGSVTTRTLTPTGHTLTVNYNPGTSGGSLTVEVLDANGNPIPGYTAADATAIPSNALAPGATVSWGGTTTLPSGPIRLRFDITGGDLYAFTVN
jgi:hypothetical protein